MRGFLTATDEHNVLMPDRIKKDLSKFGYKLYYQLLNASDYGIPQNRYRVILIGVRQDIQNHFTFPSYIDNHGDLTIDITCDKRTLTVEQVLDKPLPPGELEEIGHLSPQIQNIISEIPEGGSWKNIPYDKLPKRLKKIRDNIQKHKSPTFFRRFARNEIMGTITASATPEHSGILHPTQNRKYSIREVARFQSFPDTFQFIGASTSKKYRMIGNAVPCELAYRLASAIKNRYFKQGGNNVIEKRI